MAETTTSDDTVDTDGSDEQTSTKSSDSGAKESTEPTGAKAVAKSRPGRRPTAEATPDRWKSIAVILGVVSVVALGAAATFGTLWATDDSSDRLNSLQEQLDVDAEAEGVASEYALAVSQVDHSDLDAWRSALVDNVSEQLKPKLEGAVDVVAPWLSEMEYVSTAKLLAATVNSHDGDQYVVQVFVDMNSKSRQAPSGVAATASYTVTMDRASGWTITDVGGVGTELPSAPVGAPQDVEAPQDVPAPEADPATPPG